MRYLTILLLGAFFMTGCKNTKTEDMKAKKQLMYQIDSVDKQTGVQRMKSWLVEQEIVAGTKHYQLYINRIPSDSLPLVKSDMGTFSDNVIIVTITRQDHSRLFSKTFVKRDFSSFLSDNYLNKTILEGVVFDVEKTEKANGNIILAASVSYPGSDLYIPFSVTITPFGKMSIDKDEDAVDIPVTVVDSVESSED
ncbi:DUF4738 domain-containing protein [Phocaeicola oris]|uniref:DUF4738 domain-containing protein n=1 Tax=Phocaeicola oris TaxID=2896850 RepID=UPI00234F015C|nr:DUF4738 domain-containing protein [Phocaeicola oris]MCE2615532.1 DUF4738 domain-containing protein [Phocaeicola oris]